MAGTNLKEYNARLKEFFWGGVGEGDSGCLYDPVRFVYYVYPWGKKGTMLVHEKGPDDWQVEVLGEIGDLLRCQEWGEDWVDFKTGKEWEVGNVIQYAMKAGRGPGKTCLLAWILHWFATCYPVYQAMVTANTGDQLREKTWRELRKWWGVSVHKHWFTMSSDKFARTDKPGTCFVSAVTWSKDRPQAVAGAHEEWVLVVMDEASAIDDIIWETLEGGMTDPHVLWIVAGNPTENRGRFKECFDGGRFAHRWIQRTIDSRDSKKADKEKIKSYEDDYGEDSDFFRIWVRGEFPRQSLQQLIPESVVHEAVERSYDAEVWHDNPVSLGVDVAEHGGNRNVILVRQGLQTREVFKYAPSATDDQPTMTLTEHVIRYINAYNPQVIAVDTVGIGRGVVDRLRQLGFNNVHVVKGGRKASDEEKYADKNAEMWDSMKTWLLNGGAIPNDEGLKRGLYSRKYAFDKRDRLQLERKKDMDESPDEADALAYTFAIQGKLDIRITRNYATKLMDYVEGRIPFDPDIYPGRSSSYMNFGPGRH